MKKTLSIEAFRQLYCGEDEFAVIDPREQMLFARGHLFAATNMPLSRLEIEAAAGIPNKTTRIVLCDDGEGSARQAAAVLDDMGYANCSILDGGLPVWAHSGGAVFSGVNVPSKAFGEVVEHRLATPQISAAELHDKIAGDDDFLLLDSRPLDEHENYCIPGALCCPSAEMVLRASELHDQSDKDVVVHCAGRTRAIIGAQTLIDSGLFKSVRALTNGTPAWVFEGFSVLRGDQRELPLPHAPNARALEIARNIREKWSIAALDARELEDWQGGDGTRYVFDIRSADEYEAGHLPGARHAPGGQLLQTTEAHLPVQNAHVALVDADGVRAATAAMWLRRMGWRNVVTHTLAHGQLPLESGYPRQFSIAHEDWIDAHDARQLHASGGAVFCDLRSSVRYRAQHISGAAFLSRADLQRDTAALPMEQRMILVADDTDYAALVLRDLKSEGRSASVLQGGMPGWIAADCPVEAGMQWLLSRPTDCNLDPENYDALSARIRENRAYLSWEVALIDHIEGDPAVRFDLSNDGA